MGTTWEARIAGIWADASRSTPQETMVRIDDLVAERQPDDPEALFEAASARDYADREADAEPLYRRALHLGLTEPSRARAVIQLASTLRNLGRPEEAITMLQEGFADHPDHHLADAARAFLALCLVDVGDATAAVAVALETVAGHLPEYGNSVRAYSADLLR